MKKYIIPTIKVKEVEIEQILAGSNPASETLDGKSQLETSDDIEAKKYGSVSVWDD